MARLLTDRLSEIGLLERKAEVASLLYALDIIDARHKDTTPHIKEMSCLQPHRSKSPNSESMIGRCNENGVGCSRLGPKHGDSCILGCR